MSNETPTSNLNDHGTMQKKDNLPLIVLSVAGLLFCVFLGIAFVLARPYLQSKTFIVLEPDYSKVSKVTPDDLNEAVRILNERCKAMEGCSFISFTVSKDNQIVGRAPSFFTSKPDEKLLERITAPGLLEFVDFGNTPPPVDSIVTTSFDKADLSQPNNPVWHTIMTNEDIASVEVTKNSVGQNEISFTLTDNGTKIFDDFTSIHVGDYLGIVLDKIVLSVPVISQPITDGSGVIQGNFTIEEAHQLAVYMQITPLPIPLIIVEPPSN